MAFNPADADRLLTAASALHPVTEKKMMGGLCYFVNGNMLCGVDLNANAQGRFMIRVGKENEATALNLDGVTQVALGGRKMGGMVFVDEPSCSDDQLNTLLRLAFDFVGTMPPKG